MSAKVLPAQIAKGIAFPSKVIADADKQGIEFINVICEQQAPAPRLYSIPLRDFIEQSKTVGDMDILSKSYFFAM